MPLTQGTRLGPYEIVSSLGAGGMGEIYRATDSRLGRTVAVKVLPQDAVADPARLQRFEQEARAVGALNHPNVLAVYDVGREGATPYLVTELLEGDTLRKRLGDGPIAVKKSLEIAAQIARGLAAAHERGIVHRDLKPENVFVTRDGTTKILDFGLAKLLARADGATPADGAARLTEVGQILGTVGYMAPEQVRGEAVDAVADVFAFGAILFEMLTGETAFLGATPVEILHAILRDDPMPRLEARADVPAAVVGVVRRCLEKDREQRFRSMRDLAFMLESMATSSGERSMRPSSDAAAPARLRRLATWSGWLAAAVVAILAVIASLHGPAASPTVPQPARFAIPLPPDVTLREMAFSPDGRRLVLWTSSGDGKNQLWLRDLASLALTPLAPESGGRYPSFSADGREVAFYSNAKTLVVIDVESGVQRTICPWPQPRSRAAFGADGVIIFSPGFDTPLMRVAAAGGTPEPATELDASSFEGSHRDPVFLPDGRSFLYRARHESDAEGKTRDDDVFLARVGSKERRRVLSTTSRVEFVLPGFLLYRRDAKLVAQPFDPADYTLADETVVLAQDVTRRVFAASATGRLAFQDGDKDRGRTELVWFDRTGRRLSRLGDPGLYGEPNLSPDGREIAAVVYDLDTIRSDVWIFDLARDVRTRLTHGDNAANPVWFPDGRRIAFASRGRADMTMVVRSLDGAAPGVGLADDAQWPCDWSKDGQWFAYEPVAEREGVRFCHADGTPSAAHPEILRAERVVFSPDVRHVAYDSDESGRWEVYVRTFPELGGKCQLSTAGGSQPRWRGDGRELFYLGDDLTLMSVDFTERDGALAPGKPRALFPTRAFIINYCYCVTPDGERFLINVQCDPNPTPITVVLDATSLMRR